MPAIDPNAPSPPPEAPLAPPLQIILTASQADKVRGLTAKRHALAPAPLSDGTFSLPMSVLDDPAHAKFKATLKALPTRSVDPTEYLGYKANRSDVLAPEIVTALDAASYKSSWQAGKAVTVDPTVMAAAVSAKSASK